MAGTIAQCFAPRDPRGEQGKQTEFATPPELGVATRRSISQRDVHGAHSGAHSHYAPAC